MTAEPNGSAVTLLFRFCWGLDAALKELPHAK